MRAPLILEIIRLCRKIDETAQEVYAKLSQLSKDKTLAAFWEEMSQEELDHISFWKHTEQIEALSGLPIPFEHPEKIIAELESSFLRARELLYSCDLECSVSEAFTIAYRMEFYLLHPAFEMLFLMLKPSEGMKSPEDAYESHIDAFISMLEKQDDVSPELELLGETLQRLWRENRRLARHSTRDDLTGVLNRRGFFTIALQFANLAQRNKLLVGAMMIDLDHFKSVNDRYGHNTGDVVLKRIANLLSDSLRSSDIIGRYGGEEFIVMLPYIEGSSLGIIAEKLRQIIEETTVEGIHTTISLGYAQETLGIQFEEDLQGLIKKADNALYQAKASGRNRAVGYQKA